MNSVSKTLIVLQLFLSIMFMAFAAAVYQTNNKWQTYAKSMETERDQARTTLTQIQNNRAEEKAKYEDQITAITAENQVNLAKANTAQLALDEVRGTGGVEGQLTKAQIKATVAQAEAEVASKEAAARLAENRELRAEVSKLRGQVDRLVAEGRRKDDTILESSRTIASAISKDKVDQETIARLSTIIRFNGLNPRAKIDASGQLVAEGREPVELVQGKVLSAKRSGRLEFVSISLGQDDAVEVGNRLHIYRGEKFIADIILRQVDSDGAVGVVDEKLRNGMIQRDDNVTSKL